MLAGNEKVCGAVADREHKKMWITLPNGGHIAIECPFGLSPDEMALVEKAIDLWLDIQRECSKANEMDFQI